MSVNLFDANFYRAANAELRSFNDTQALDHFQRIGLNEGRAFSPLVDLNFYRASNSDLRSFDNRQAYEHLSNFGVKEGRRFSPFVDLNFYRANNNDLKTFNNEQLLNHLRTFGVSEGRSFSPFVDLNFYRADNNDLIRAGLNNNQLLDHLAIHGLKEGREFSASIDLEYYLKSNADVNQAFGGDRLLALEHLETYGITEGRTFSRFVDLNYYLSKNSDVNQAFAGNKMRAFEHLVSFGISEGRQCSTVFDVNFYRNNYSDLKNAGLTNKQLFEHWVIFGASREKRVGSADSGGNTVDTALNLGSLANSPASYSGSVGGTDKNDYFRFTLNDSRNVSINLSGLAGDLDVTLLDGQGNPLADSKGQPLVDPTKTTVSPLTAPHATGTTSEAINFFSLKAGSYTIRVYQGETNASSDYNLSVNALPVQDPGISTTAAYSLGDVNSPVKNVIFGSVGGNDTDDYYQLNLTKNGLFSMKLVPLSTENADLFLLDSKGIAMMSSVKPGNTPDSKSNINLAAGTYYVRVQGFINPTDYQLALSFAESAA